MSFAPSMTGVGVSYGWADFLSIDDFGAAFSHGITSMTGRGSMTSRCPLMPSPCSGP